MSEQSQTGRAADILLVEDNPGDIRLTREAFQESSIANTLHVVTDGVEALDFLPKRGDYEDAPRPDIIPLDLNLPGKNGDGVLGEPKAVSPDRSRIPVIISTSSRAEEATVRSYELQANAYLTTPVDPGELIEAIQRFKSFWLKVVRLPSGEEE